MLHGMGMRSRPGFGFETVYGITAGSSGQKEAEHRGKSKGGKRAARNRQESSKKAATKQQESNPHLQLHSHSQSQSQLSSQVTATSKAILNEENVVRNALEVADEEELLRRTTNRQPTPLHALPKLTGERV